MGNRQTILLTALAKKLKEQATSREAAIKSLSSAGITTKTGKISKSFPNLERVLASAE